MRYRSCTTAGVHRAHVSACMLLSAFPCPTQALALYRTPLTRVPHVHIRQSNGLTVKRLRQQQLRECMHVYLYRCFGYTRSRAGRTLEVDEQYLSERTIEESPGELWV